MKAVTRGRKPGVPNVPEQVIHLLHPGAYSSRSASSGEIKLARTAGISAAANADKPSVTTAATVTRAFNGFMP